MSDLRQLQSHEWSISTSFHEIETGYFQHQFCKAFLLRAFMGRCNAEHFQVLRVMGRDKDGYALRPPTVHDTDEDEFLSVSDPILEATVLFDGQAYDLVVATVSQYSNMKYYVAAVGLSRESKHPAALINLFLRLSVTNSPYRGRCIQTRYLESHAQISIVPFKELGDAKLNKLFLPTTVTCEIRLCIEAIRKHRQLKTYLPRVLNVGPPGCGKTLTSLAIANELRGEATSIFSNGASDTFDAAFELAESLASPDGTPVVLFADDIDQIAPDRGGVSQSRTLGSFLQRLDGFLKPGIAIICSSNDKSLIDAAARRPGRFDLILEFGRLSEQYYLDFVQSKTSREDIATLFVGDVIQSLADREVTGAFLAALLRRLELLNTLGGQDLSQRLVLETIDFMYKSFYKQSQSTGERVGFHMYKQKD